MSTHSLVSPSAAERWMACPPSVRLSERYPKVSRAEADEGTQAHAIAAAKLSGEIYECDDHAMDWYTDRYVDYVHALCSGYAEQGKYITMMVEEQLDLTDWIPEGKGYADCVIVTTDGLHVVDFKYGIGVPVHAAGNPQMRLYALGAYKALTGIYDNLTQVRYSIAQPRLYSYSTEETSIDELLTWAEQTVKPLALDAVIGAGDLHAGEHCRFCPARGHCKAMIGSYHQWADRIADGATISEDERNQVLETGDIVASWIKAVQEAALQDALSGKTVKGYKVVAGRSTRVWADTQQTTDWLRERGYDEAAVTKRELLSPAALTKAYPEVKKDIEHLIVKRDGSPALVPDSDKRPAINSNDDAINDFSNK